MSKGRSDTAIRRLSRRNIKEHPSRNILIVVIVTLLVGGIVALNVLGTSAYYNIQSFYLQQFGSKGHLRMDNLSDSNIEKLKTYSEVKEMGKSVLVGNAVNQEFHGKTVEIRYADENYAEYTFAKPEQGRMPETRDEIAVDTMVLKDFGIENGIGQSIELKWIENEEEVKKSFQIVGVWENSKVTSKHKIWVSEDIVNDYQQLAQTVEIMFESKNIEESSREMLQTLQMEEMSYKINEVYNEGVSQSIKMDTLAYVIGVIAILISGVLIMHSIIHISYVTDMKLYARIKTLGATPKQIRKSVMWQNLILCIPGIIIGLIVGVVVAKFLLPIVFQNLQVQPQLYMEWQDFLLALALIFFIVVMAVIKPAHTAGKINPSDLLSEEDNIYFKGKSERRIPGLPVLFQMAVYNIGRNKRKSILMIFLLVLGIVSMGSIYVIHKSFDLELYMDEIALSDFTLSERTLVDSWEEYDCKGTTLSPDILKNIMGLEGVYEMGRLYSQNISVMLPDRTYDNLIRYYEQNDGEILKYMEQSIGWTEGYYKMKETHECAATVFGVDGLVNDRLAEKNLVLEGKVDKEKFLSGDYVLAQGMEGIETAYEHPTYSVGDMVKIGGKEYEVMAIISAPYPVTEGKVNPGYEFSLQFFMPNSEFNELYPDNTVRRAFFNVDSSQKEYIQDYLEEYVERNNIPMISEKSIAQEYKKETSASMMIANIVAGMIFLIGIINMVNAVVTSVNMRKKEFAMMQSIGMTKKQLRLLLIFEGIGVALISLLLSYFLSFLVINTGVKAYLSAKWTATYNFTITPLLIITPILILIAIGVPVLCFNRMQKKEIIERLDEDIE
ncbi:hypothetical protein C806_02353 [Lachnospiraceae bacterium 3-1]|nr:hypothetical protein C806_02353 [Lachnospiraceae bacterium 3-1]